MNEETTDDFVEDENCEDTSGLDQSSRDFLEMAIRDYNRMFQTTYDTSSDKFQNYYKDVSLRMKNREIDILIVVNMFLTGFDATTLNTLWVDKNLKYHGLIQAFSRTNRILNSVKTYGNIVCFRNLEQETNDAIALFGDENAGSIVLLKNYESYYCGYEEDGKHYDGYVELLDRLKMQFPLGQRIEGEKNQKDFVSLYGAILRAKNILSSFDAFEGNEILTTRDFQDYQSIYLDLYQELRPKKNDQKDGNKDKEILITIEKAVQSSMNLRSKIKMIQDFLQTVNADTKVDEDWQKFIREQKEQDLMLIIHEEKLKSEETHKFVEDAFRDGILKTTGTDIDFILPAVSRFGGSGVNRVKKKKTVIDRLMAYFEKYRELVSINRE